MLFTVQVYRGLAVLLVVLYHGTIIVANRYGIPPFFDIFRLGFSGVHLFFVLSGFIILTAHVKDIGVPGRLAWYVNRRLIRIYPIYWIIFFIWGGWRLISVKPDIKGFVLNALLFMWKGEKLIIPVSWTLVYEIIFYAIFAVLVISKRIGVIVIVIWFVSILLIKDKASHQVLHPLNLMFIFGMTTAGLFFWIKKLNAGLRNIISVTSFVLGAMMFLGTAVYYSTLTVDKLIWSEHPVTIIGFGIASALLILASASESIENFFMKRYLLVLIGNASYSIYLVHIQFEKIAFDAVKSVDLIWQEGGHGQIISDMLLVFIVLVAVLCGIIIHLMIERPLLSFLRGMTNTTGRRMNICLSHSSRRAE